MLCYQALLFLRFGLIFCLSYFVVVVVVVQHAIAYVEGDKYYGAKATINVWEPKIQQPNEFSLSQLWILGGSFGQDLNSIEAGWQVLKICIRSTRAWKKLLIFETLVFFLQTLMPECA